MIAEILSLFLMSQRDDFHSENCHIYLTSVCWHRRSPLLLWKPQIKWIQVKTVRGQS